MKSSKTPRGWCLRVLAGCLSIVVVVWCLSGCRKKESATPPPGKQAAHPAAPSPAGPAKADAVVVTVNGSPIKESDIEKRIMTELQTRAGGNMARFTPEMIDQYKKVMRPQAIEVLTGELLLDEQVKAAQIKVTDQDVVTTINAEAAKLDPPLTFERYKQIFVDQGIDFNEILTRLKLSLARQRFMESRLAGKTDVNEAQAKAFYDANPKRFEQPEQVRASHILIVPDPNAADPNQAKVAAKEKAQKLLAKLKEGADFAELAKVNSSDPSSAPRGGDVDFFPRGDMEKPFEDAAFALPQGQLSDVVETRYGYHIIKVTERKPASMVPFEQVKQDLISFLSQQKGGDVLEEYIQSLRAKAKIVYVSPSDAPQPEASSGPMPSEAKPPADANQK